MLSYISVVNSVNGSCPWLKQPIPCDFALCNNNNITTLTPEQRLLPNTDITGANVMIMFMVTGFVAAVLTVALLVDEALVLFKPVSKEKCVSKIY
jgi:hypothetical protein